jgi:hypothetical protein
VSLWRSSQVQLDSTDTWQIKLELHGAHAMNISSIGQNTTATAVASPQSTPSAQAVRPVHSEHEGHGDSPQKAHHHHGGGGRMHHALASALQSLGLTLPAGESSDMKNGDDKKIGASVDKQGSASTAASNVEQDMRQFMHALFQAVKGQAASNSPDVAANSGANPTATPSVKTGEGERHDMRDKFATGLANLISQVAAGKAPAELQAAFTKLAADLQPTKAAGSAAPAPTSANTSAPTPMPTPTPTPTPTPANTNGTKPAVTLQAVLSALQQQIGYSRSASPAIGNTINIKA